MKKLVTVSAVVFFMIFTAGLATAKTTPFFPFSGSGYFESTTTAGSFTAGILGSITVKEVSGSGLLWYGTITWGSTTADFSAVSDATYSGTLIPAPTVVFTFTGLTTGSTPVPVQGAFTFGAAKDPADEDKNVDAAFVALFVPSSGESFAGTLFIE